MTILETGEAIVFLQNQELAFQLGNMKPLVIEGVSVDFCRWTPEFNSFEQTIINPNFVWIHLMGVPLHLKKKEIAEAIVQRYCSSAEERGYSFPVLIEVVAAKPLFPHILTKGVIDLSHQKCDREYLIKYVTDEYPEEGSSVREKVLTNGKGNLGVLDHKDDGGTGQHVAFGDSPERIPLQNAEEITAGSGVNDKTGLNFESFHEVIKRKGKAVASDHDNAVASEEWVGWKQRNGSRPKKNKKARSWVSNPSTILSRKVLTSTMKKKKKEQNDKLVRRVLHYLDLYEARQNSGAQAKEQLCSEGLMKPNSDQGSENLNEAQSDATNFQARVPARSGMHPLSKEVDSVPETQFSYPPGFEEVSTLDILKRKLKERESVMMNENSLAEILDDLLEPVAVQLGVSSNLGAKFVEFIMNE
ncbi:hypothetical protein FRX31_033650 [Thalictrum thalictroides]|uniref:DUF4283 domain-containing protein n=1 Tax=Thalictrum thalictroides TaxID=46969 RepID=A0A7J6UVX1_THATH|nr:hypothetical protein FRX31_033650 [Thalictrum thalictroides]